MDAQRPAIVAGLMMLATALSVSAVAQQAALRQPMIFFHAKGGADACGPGCTEWIGAEGTFGPDTLGRLSAFLHSLGRSDLPIFFHSPGGSGYAAMAVGHKLRGWRIAAGIGRTVVQGCKSIDPRDEHCLELLQSEQMLPATLSFDGAICASACVTALIGAPTRQVNDRARLGIHAANYAYDRQWSVDTSAVERAARANWMDSFRHYFVSMGVDGSLIEEMEKTPHNGIHWLSREQMRHFGILNSGMFETGWALVESPSPTIIKSLTRPAPRTTLLKIRCQMRDRAQIVIRRELADDERGSQSTIRLVSGRDAIAQSRSVNEQRDDERVVAVPITALRGIAANGLVLEERITKATGEAIRTFSFATAGLAEVLDRLLPHCGVAKPQPAPPKPRYLRFASDRGW